MTDRVHTSVVDVLCVVSITAEVTSYLDKWQPINMMPLNESKPH